MPVDPPRVCLSVFRPGRPATVSPTSASFGPQLLVSPRQPCPPPSAVRWFCWLYPIPPTPIAPFQQFIFAALAGHHCEYCIAFSDSKAFLFDPSSACLYTQPADSLVIVHTPCSAFVVKVRVCMHVRLCIPFQQFNPASSCWNLPESAIGPLILNLKPLSFLNL